ncbi:MFS transporter [Speluncibacter jeojiensis]|uniref:MFS transporter n=1 Tax=Speluncibacter jeojiensis TaxID=2710754 RepID=A0A9X4LXE4_9ACTN|nr:MFS transporter [Corynebacteriales bacterium D3-21]
MTSGQERDARPGLIAGRVLVLLAIVLSALTLRTAVTAITPLLDVIGDEVGFGSAVAGVFGMMPTAMFALFGLLTPMLATRFGLERIALVAMVMAGVGMLTRAMVGDTAMLLVLSAVALGGMGIGNVVIPPLVKRYFSDRVALMSAVYITCVQLGTAVPPLLAVPVAHAHGWRVSLAVWSVVAFAAVLPWIGVIVDRRGRDARAITTPQAPQHHSTHSGRPIWHSSLAWGMAAMFGMTSLITYSLFTWLPKILTESGASAEFGGAMVAMFSAVGFIAALGAPTLCARMVNPFPVVMACAVCYLVGFAGLVFAPSTVPWLWVLAIGLGPSTFPMSLTLINLRSRTGAGSSKLSGFTQGVGYTAACLGPVLFGVLHESTDGWGWPFAFLLVAVAVMLLGGRRACRPSMIEDDLAA